ncbi:MAG: septum formation initiator family protein [Desulfotomaculum sp.]|nr:septum formation initiator family protein [Desulfotomaculum sp.]
MISASENHDNIIPMKKRKKVRFRFLMPKMKFKLNLSILVLIFVFGCFLFSLGEKISDLNNMKHSVSELEKEIGELKAKNAELKRDLKLIKSEEYVERIAREQLGLVKPGEKVVVPGELSREELKENN